MNTVAFIGLGMMGFPMASRVVDHGYSLLVEDVSDSIVDGFLEKHSNANKLDTNSISNADFVITMLPNSKIVNQVILDKYLEHISPGSTLIDMSSSEPIESKSLAKKVLSNNVYMLDAPVSGGQKKAVSGELSIIAGGEEKVFEKSRKLLSVMGSPIHVGLIGSGHALKALNNYVSAAGLLAVVEALHVGKEFGIDPNIMTDVFNSSTGMNNTTKNKVKQYMLNSAFDSNFSLALMAKDLGIAIGLGENLAQPMKFGTVCRDICEEASANSPKADHTEIYRLM